MRNTEKRGWWAVMVVVAFLLFFLPVFVIRGECSGQVQSH